MAARFPRLIRRLAALWLLLSIAASSSLSLRTAIIRKIKGAIPFAALILFLIGGSTAKCQSLSTNNIVFSFTSIGLNPSQVTRVSIQAQNWIVSDGTAYSRDPVTLTRATTPQMTNGSVVFSNIVCGIPIQVTLTTFLANYVTNILIPVSPAPTQTNADGSVNGFNYAGEYVSPTAFFYAYINGFRFTTNFLTITNTANVTNTFNYTNNLSQTNINFQPPSTILTNLSGLSSTNQIAFTNSTFFVTPAQLAAGTNAAQSGATAALISTNTQTLTALTAGTNAAIAGAQVTLNLTNATLLSTLNTASNAVYQAGTNALNVQINLLGARATNNDMTLSNNVYSASTNAGTVQIGLLGASVTNGYMIASNNVYQASTNALNVQIGLLGARATNNDMTLSNNVYSASTNAGTVQIGLLGASVTNGYMAASNNLSVANLVQSNALTSAIYTNGINSTNLIIGTSNAVDTAWRGATNRLGNSAYQNTNVFDLAGAGAAAAIAVTNAGNIVFTNQVAAITNKVVFTNDTTFFDSKGAAQAATNSPAIVKTNNPIFVNAITNGDLRVVNLFSNFSASAITIGTLNNSDWEQNYLDTSVTGQVWLVAGNLYSESESALRLGDQSRSGLVSPNIITKNLFGTALTVDDFEGEEFLSATGNGDMTVYWDAYKLPNFTFSSVYDGDSLPVIGAENVTFLINGLSAGTNGNPSGIPLYGRSFIFQAEDNRQPTLNGGAGGSIILLGGSGTNAATGNILLNTNGGFVGIGTPSPKYQLEISGTNKASVFIGNLDASNLVGQFLAPLVTNNAPSVSFKSNSIFGQLSFSDQQNYLLRATNFFFIENSGSVMDGTYTVIGSGSFTNNLKSGFGALSDGSNLNVQSNSVTMYRIALASIPGTATIVNGASPAPRIGWGGSNDLNGFVLTGDFNSASAAAQWTAADNANSNGVVSLMTARLNAATLALTNHIDTNSVQMSNFVFAVSQNLTNDIFSTSNSAVASATNAPSSQSAFNATNNMAIPTGIMAFWPTNIWMTTFQATNAITNNAWGLNGNNSTSNNFVGTLNNNPLNIQVNGSRLAEFQWGGGGGSINLGIGNYVDVGQSNSAILSGTLNTLPNLNGIANYKGFDVIVGGIGNINYGTHNGFIGNGETNSLTSNFAETIVNGRSNLVHSVGYGTIVNGEQIGIGIGGDYSFIGNGTVNTNNVQYAFIGNGIHNSTLAAFASASVLNGKSNTINGASYSFIGNGILNSENNSLGSSGNFAFLGTGNNNVIVQQNATLTGNYNTIENGQFNVISNSTYSTIVNGFSNSLYSSSNSMIFGNSIMASNKNIIVLSEIPAINTTVDNQILFGAANGVGINTNVTSYGLSVNGSFILNGTNIFTTINQALSTNGILNTVSNVTIPGWFNSGNTLSNLYTTNLFTTNLTAQYLSGNGSNVTNVRLVNLITNGTAGAAAGNFVAISPSGGIFTTNLSPTVTTNYNNLFAQNLTVTGAVASASLVATGTVHSSTMIVSNFLSVVANTINDPGIHFQVHTGPNRNLCLQDDSSNGRIQISSLNDANTINQPLAFSGGGIYFYQNGGAAVFNDDVNGINNLTANHILSQGDIQAGGAFDFSLPSELIDQTSSGGSDGQILSAQSGSVTWIDQSTLAIGGSQLTGIISTANLPPNGNYLTNVATGYWTNLVNGVTNVNKGQQIQSWHIPAIATSPATTLGHAEIDAQVQRGDGVWITLDKVEIAGGATSILATNKNDLHFDVYSGQSWRLTNNVSGTGYTAGLDPDGSVTNQVLFH